MKPIKDISSNGPSSLSTGPSDIASDVPVQSVSLPGMSIDLSNQEKPEVAAPTPGAPIGDNQTQGTMPTDQEQSALDTVSRTPASDVELLQLDDKELDSIAGSIAGTKTTDKEFDFLGMKARISNGEPQVYSKSVGAFVPAASVPGVKEFVKKYDDRIVDSFKGAAMLTGAVGGSAIGGPLAGGAGAFLGENIGAGLGSAIAPRVRRMVMNDDHRTFVESLLGGQDDHFINDWTKESATNAVFSAAIGLPVHFGNKLVQNSKAGIAELLNQLNASKEIEDLSKKYGIDFTPGQSMGGQTGNDVTQLENAIQSGQFKQAAASDMRAQRQYSGRQIINQLRDLFDRVSPGYDMFNADAILSSKRGGARNFVDDIIEGLHGDLSAARRDAKEALGNKRVFNGTALKEDFDRVIRENFGDLSVTQKVGNDVVRTPVVRPDGSINKKALFDYMNKNGAASKDIGAFFDAYKRLEDATTRPSGGLNSSARSESKHFMDYPSEDSKVFVATSATTRPSSSGSVKSYPDLEMLNIRERSGVMTPGPNSGELLGNEKYFTKVGGNEIPGSSVGTPPPAPSSPVDIGMTEVPSARGSVPESVSAIPEPILPPGMSEADYSRSRRNYYRQETAKRALLDQGKAGAREANMTFDEFTSFVDRLQNISNIGGKTQTALESKMSAIAHNAKVQEAEIVEKTMRDKGMHSQADFIAAVKQKYSEGIDSLRNLRQSIGTNIDMVGERLLNLPPKEITMLMESATKEQRDHIKGQVLSSLMRDFDKLSIPASMAGIVEGFNAAQLTRAAISDPVMKKKLIATIGEDSVKVLGDLAKIGESWNASYTSRRSSQSDGKFVSAMAHLVMGAVGLGIPISHSMSLLNAAKAMAPKDPAIMKMLDSKLGNIEKALAKRQSILERVGKVSSIASKLPAKGSAARAILDQSRGMFGDQPPLPSDVRMK